VFLPMIVSAGIWSVAVIAFSSISAWQGSAISPVLWCGIVSIPLLVFNSQVEMTLRVSERSRLLTTTKIVSRWMELALVLSAVVLIQRSALSVYAGKLVCMTIVALFYASWVKRHLHFSRAAIDLPAYRASLHYSLPLVLNEIAGAALVSIDRVMLKHMLDDYAVVGIYTIGYALAMQLSVLMNVPTWDAFIPVANRVHGLEGAAMVRALKAKVLLPATYACIGMSVAIWAIGSDGFADAQWPQQGRIGTGVRLGRLHVSAGAVDGPGRLRPAAAQEVQDRIGADADGVGHQYRPEPDVDTDPRLHGRGVRDGGRLHDDERGAMPAVPAEPVSDA
jgi:hypothetical protein